MLSFLGRVPEAGGGAGAEGGRRAGVGQPHLRPRHAPGPAADRSQQTRTRTGLGQINDRTRRRFFIY